MISSVTNPRVQAARKLHRKRTRDETGTFLAEGPNVVGEALASSWDVLEVFHTPDASPSVELAGAEPRRVTLTEVSEKVMQSLSSTQTPQGIVAVVRRPRSTARFHVKTELALVLAEVRDPGNAGTLLRSALACGAGVVFFTPASVDPFNPKCVRASAGSLFHLEVVTGITVEEAATQLEESGFQIVAADAAADLSMDQIDLTRPTAIVLGNEASGLPPGPTTFDRKVRIPMPGPTESLNVAVAGSILLYEAVRQRRGVSSSLPNTPSGGPA